MIYVNKFEFSLKLRLQYLVLLETMGELHKWGESNVFGFGLPVSLQCHYCKWFFLVSDVTREVLVSSCDLRRENISEILFFFQGLCK